MNGRNPSPKLVRQYTAKFRYYLTYYGSKGEDERFYLKVDSKKTPISKVMFNDDEEHSFLITSHVINMDLQKNFFPVDASRRSIDLLTQDDEGINCKEDVDWNTTLSFANFFPLKFLSVLEEVFPYVADAVKSAEATKRTLSQEIRLTLMGHNAKALSKWREVTRAYGLHDVTGSQCLMGRRESSNLDFLE